MKRFIKKYWYWALIIVSLPIIINYILLIPAFTPIVGTNDSWLSFWGGYLGTLAAFIILAVQYTQNKKENEKNRKLQFDILHYEQEMRWLDSFRAVGLNIAKTYCHNNLVEIITMMQANPKIAFDLIRQNFNNTQITDAQFHYTEKHDTAANKLDDFLVQKYRKYNAIIWDLQSIIVTMMDESVTTPTQFYSRIRQYNISTYLQTVISEYQNTPNNITNVTSQSEKPQLNNSARDIQLNLANKLITTFEHDSDDIRQQICDYITAEQQRINKIVKL